ncbi:dockerin type I domain-containing protein [Ruminococcus albus]|uniref:dockerin type I domain-containing protein n=1 Tax=Ruminococcus albus TaxID=1264 RepID=UPI000465D2F2|nr:dockerin type I domain-containing protein [Ruminococcus albus]
MANFKKKMASALAVLSLFTYASATCMTASASNFIGDVNNDNKINNNDTLTLQNYVVTNSGSINRNNADVNGDGDINIADVVSLMQTVKRGIIADATPITGLGCLRIGKWYSSPNDKYFVVYQGNDGKNFNGDGNLVIYRRDGNKRTPCWSSGTNGCDADFCQLQNDGNFVIYNKNRKPIWSTESYKSPAGVFINNNGELFVYSFKDCCKVWTSANSRGTKIYQPPIKPVHTCTNIFMNKNGKIVYGCKDCNHIIDQDVDYAEYVRVTMDEEHRYDKKEDALAHYFKLLNKDLDLDAAKKAAKAFYGVVDLNETQKTGLRKFLEENDKFYDDFKLDYLPDCDGKTYIAQCQFANKSLKVYDLLTNNNSKTVDINTLNTTIDVLQTAVDFVKLGSKTYGKVLDEIRTSAKKSIQAGLEDNIRTLLSNLNDTTLDPDQVGSEYFWEQEVTADNLSYKKFQFGNGTFTVKQYFTKKCEEERGNKNEYEAAYKAFVNLKCVQAATDIRFFDLVDTF